MASTYTTIQGETWDSIAFKVYGGEEYAAFLMQNNFDCLDILVFSAGTVLNTPSISVVISSELPPWRDEGEETDVDPYNDYEEGES